MQFMAAFKDFKSQSLVCGKSAHMTNRPSFNFHRHQLTSGIIIENFITSTKALICYEQTLYSLSSKLALCNFEFKQTSRRFRASDKILFQKAF